MAASGRKKETAIRRDMPSDATLQKGLFLEAGASLTELLVVVAIIGLATVWGGESFLALASRQQEKTVMAEIAAELRFARQLAIGRRERVRVVFDPESASMRTERADGSGHRLRAYQYGGKGMVIEGLSGGAQILFHPSGRSASPTTIVLRGRSGERRTITVSMTGRVALS
jgi:type IV fimbrial biogenesis protein FimT